MSVQIIRAISKSNVMKKGERTLDLWGTPILLKSSNLNGIISRFLQTGTITYCAWKITFLDAKKH